MDINEIKKLIGNTPIIKIRCKYNGEVRNVFVKLEWYNLTGSIKDRPAYYIIREAQKEGKLKKGQPIIEATSGNMGISIAGIGSALGYEVHIFMPSWMSQERKILLKHYGAILHEVTREEGGFQGSIKLADELAKEVDGFRANQFSSKDNVEAHYEWTANEIIRDMGGRNIDAFVSGIGTGGTLMGVSKRLKEANPGVLTCAFEPDTSAILTLGYATGHHKIAGVGDDFIPEIVDKNQIDKILLINDDDAINMARKLSLKLGLGVGISSGANFLSAVIVNEGNCKNVVTVFPDDNKKYLTSDLSQPIDTNNRFISNHIECLDYEVL